MGEVQFRVLTTTESFIARPSSHQQSIPTTPRAYPNELYFLLKPLTKVKILLMPDTKSFPTSVSKLINDEWVV